MAAGYAGRYLQVDLTAGCCSDFTLGDDLLRRFIGGSSLAAKLYLDGHPLTAEPHAPENPLLVMTGPKIGRAHD